MALANLQDLNEDYHNGDTYVPAIEIIRIKEFVGELRSTIMLNHWYFTNPVSLFLNGEEHEIMPKHVGNFEPMFMIDNGADLEFEDAWKTIINLLLGV